MTAFGMLSGAGERMPLGQRLWQISWSMVLLISVTAGIGVAMLYSAADGAWEPWAFRHAVRFVPCLVMLVVLSVIDLKVWMRWAYVLYGLSIGLLGLVEVMGEIGMGAQRWIDLGVLNIQPSEIMKVTLVLALARYFHGLSYEETGRIANLLAPVAMIGAPVALVLGQPDLGTAVMLVLVGAAVLFGAGVRLWKFITVGLAVLAAVPVVWGTLRDYQKKRILTFLDPDSDPLGSGYHILQSKIALGSGGLFGRGFQQGTQGHLNFLPEKHTDFIFTMLAEEFGLFGALGLIGLFIMLVMFGVVTAFRCRSQFARLLALGLATNLFLYVFINIAMATGLIPVVGVPLPLISYGGTAMLVVMGGFGLIMSAHVHRDVRIGRRWQEEE